MQSRFFFILQLLVVAISCFTAVSSNASLGEFDADWQERKFDVTAMDNAIYDTLKVCSEKELRKILQPLGVKIGQMSLIDESTASKLATQVVMTQAAAGGSAANSIANLQQLGGSTAFIGVTNDDDAGHKFNKSLSEIGVKVVNQPQKMNKPSGQSFIFIVPDKERTMLTYLGASNDFSDEDIDYQVIKNSKVLLLQAYLLDNGKTSALVNKIVDFANAHNVLVALALSSEFKANKHKEEIKKLLPRISLMIGNEKEFEAVFTESNTKTLVNKLKDEDFISVFTMSHKGAYIINQGEITYLAAPKIKPVTDVTGAGDAFAGGFLYGYTHGYNLADAGKLGVATAENILQKIGARPDEDLRKLLTETD